MNEKYKRLATHQYSTRCSLARNQLSGPVFRLGHKGALELLLMLTGIFRFLDKFRLLATAQKRKHSPQQHNKQPDKKGEYTGEQEKPPFSVSQALILGRVRFLEVVLQHHQALGNFFRHFCQSIPQDSSTASTAERFTFWGRPVSSVRGSLHLADLPAELLIMGHL